MGQSYAELPSQRCLKGACRVTQLPICKVWWKWSGAAHTFSGDIQIPRNPWIKHLKSETIWRLDAVRMLLSVPAWCQPAVCPWVIHESSHSVPVSPQVAPWFPLFSWWEISMVLNEWPIEIPLHLCDIQVLSSLYLGWNLHLPRSSHLHFVILVEDKSSASSVQSR